MGSKKLTMRLTTSEAVFACRVLMTRWPVAAALMAERMVSGSRISPMTMTSGSWRNAPVTAMLKEATSLPRLRCEMMDFLLVCTYSTGFSMVSMCAQRFVLM